LFYWLSSSLRKLSRRAKPASRDLPSHFGPLTTRLCIWHRFQALRVRATRASLNLLRTLYLETWKDQVFLLFAENVINHIVITLTLGFS
jgi:hypothetical protein